MVRHARADREATFVDRRAIRTVGILVIVHAGPKSCVSSCSTLARTPAAAKARCSLPHSGQRKRAMLSRVESAVLPSTRMPLS